MSAAGAILLDTAAGTITDPPPVAYQERNGRQLPIDAAFVVLEDVKPDRLVVGFRLGDYDRSLPLVIDPALPVFVGFLGGGGDDRGLA